MTTPSRDDPSKTIFESAYGAIPNLDLLQRVPRFSCSGVSQSSQEHANLNSLLIYFDCSQLVMSTALGNFVYDRSKGITTMRFSSVASKVRNSFDRIILKMTLTTSLILMGILKILDFLIFENSFLSHVNI
jgi:hypothetical protein